MREKLVRLISCERNTEHNKNYTAHNIVLCTELGLCGPKRIIFFRGASFPAILTITGSRALDDSPRFLGEVFGRVEGLVATCFVRWGDVWTAWPERSCRLYKRSSSNAAEECFLFRAIMVSMSARVVNVEYILATQCSVTLNVHARVVTIRDFSLIEDLILPSLQEHIISLIL